MTVEGLGGRKLEEAWRDGAEAYLGVAVSGFPNLFLLYGPNTNLGHNSIIFMIECQVGYILQCIQELRRRGLAWLDVRRDVMDRYNAAVQRDLQKTSWSAGCTSWYKNESGKITNNWSGFTVEYWWKTRRLDPADFARGASPFVLRRGGRGPTTRRALGRLISPSGRGRADCCCSAPCPRGPPAPGRSSASRCR